MMPKVSILIPAFRTRWLDVAIASALAQTYQDFEIIISDDSEGDDLQNVVEKWDDSRIRYVKNPRRQAYLGSNRDNALAHATGKYIRFLYDDDFYYPRSLEFMVAAAEGTQAKLLFHARQIVDEQGKVLESPMMCAPGELCWLDAQFYYDNFLGKLTNFIGEPSNVMFEAETFRKMETPFGFAGHRMRYLADVALFTNFIAQGHLVVGLGFFGSGFRRHQGQNSNGSQPFHSAASFEWEIFRRWAMDAGHLSDQRYQAHLPVQMHWYNIWVEAYPELRPFLDMAGRPGPDGYLSAEFQRAVAGGHAAIENRMAARAV